MAKKKAEPVTEKHFSQAEGFYIESHYGLKTSEEMANELKVDVADINTYIDLLIKSSVPKKESPDIPEKAGFASKNGTVSMTQGASEKGDKVAEDLRKNPIARHMKNVHIIDPSKPIR